MTRRLATAVVGLAIMALTLSVLVGCGSGGASNHRDVSGGGPGSQARQESSGSPMAESPESQGAEAVEEAKGADVDEPGAVAKNDRKAAGEGEEPAIRIGEAEVRSDELEEKVGSKGG